MPLHDTEKEVRQLQRRADTEVFKMEQAELAVVEVHQSTPLSPPVKKQPTMVEAPKRTLEQRQSALKRANEVRVIRAALKRNLKTKAASVLDVLRDPSAEVATMKVHDLLMALPKFGKLKTARVMKEVRISHAKTIGGLSARQRMSLRVLLRERNVR